MIWLLVLILSAMSGAESKVGAVSKMELDRYLGSWHEIARFPDSFQASCAGDVTATYSMRKDGRISVLNRCREQDGRWKEAERVARPADEQARLRG